MICIWRGCSERHLKKCSSLTTLPRSTQKRLSWITKIGADWIIDIFLMFSLKEWHDWQNHSFSDVNNSYGRKSSKMTLSVMETDTMSSFSPLTEEQKQLLHVIVVLKVLESKSSVLTDVPFNSSKTAFSISTTSCWELKSKGALRVDEILHLSAHRKFEESIGTANFFLIAIFSVTDYSNSDNCADSAEEVLKSNGITLRACRMVLTKHMFPLLMKPTGDFEGVGEFDNLRSLSWL